MAATAEEGCPMTPEEFVHNPPRQTQLGSLGRVCRLGLSTRGNTKLESVDVLEAFRRGVNYFNWCGYDDGLAAAVRRLGPLRQEILIAVQLSARDRAGAEKELRGYFDMLGTEYVDVVTYYYLEHEDEWDEVSSPDGAGAALRRAELEGSVRAIGVTTHQRSLAAKIAQDRAVDLMMVRYNAAHRGAETEVFPSTSQAKIPVVAYTCLRWGALLKSTPDDPKGFEPPGAASWYRFALCHPAVSLALMAPNGRAELEEDLSLLTEWRGLDDEEHAMLCEHGDRVYEHAGEFP